MVEFRDKNYWEGQVPYLPGKGPTSPFLKPKGWTAPPAGPPQDDLSRLVAEVVGANQGGVPWGNTGANTFNPGQVMLDQNYNIPGTAIPKPRPSDVSFTPSSAPPFDQQAADQYGQAGADMVGNFLSKLTGVLSEQKNSPQNIYDMIRQNTPGYTYQGKSAEEMAASQFDPAFEMLNQIGQQQKGRYDTGAAQAKASYAAYVKALQDTQQSNAANYQQTGKQIGTNYDQASGSVTKNTENSAAALASELQKLGIADAAPGLLQKNLGEQTKQLGYLAQNRQTASDLNTQNAASTSTYDAGNVNIGRQKGIEYQGDLLSNYMDQINQNDQRRLDLQAQQGAAENQYAMQIQQLLEQAAGSREQSINQQYQAMMDQQYRQGQLGIDQRRLDLDYLKATQGQQKNTQQGAFKQLADAAQAYGMDQQTAAEVQKTFINAIRDQPLAKDLGSLLRGVPSEYLDQPFIRSLAYDFFTQYLNSK